MSAAFSTQFAHRAAPSDVVPLDELTLAALVSLEGVHGRDAFYFPGRFGGRIHPSTVYRWVTSCTPGWTLHSLRRRAATAGYAGTKDLRQRTNSSGMRLRPRHRSTRRSHLPICRRSSTPPRSANLCPSAVSRVPVCAVGSVDRRVRSRWSRKSNRGRFKAMETCEGQFRAPLVGSRRRGVVSPVDLECLKPCSCR